jgi:hypothetical protein
MFDSVQAVDFHALCERSVERDLLYHRSKACWLSFVTRGYETYWSITVIIGVIRVAEIAAAAMSPTMGFHRWLRLNVVSATSWCFSMRYGVRFDERMSVTNGL